MNDDLAYDGNTRDARRRRVQWKPHEFSDFLTETGVTAALAKAVLALYRADRRPTDPIEYVWFVRRRMKPDNADAAAIRACRRDIAELQAKADGTRAKRQWLLESGRRMRTAYDCDADEW